MHHHSHICVVLLSLYYGGCLSGVSACKQEPETPDWRMTLKTIRNGIHKIDTYLNAALDLFGGDDGLCHYKCSDGKPNFIVTHYSEHIICQTHERLNTLLVAVFHLGLTGLLHAGKLS